MGGTRERRETREQCLRTQMDVGWLRQGEGQEAASGAGRPWGGRRLDLPKSSRGFGVRLMRRLRILVGAVSSKEERRGLEGSKQWVLLGLGNG